jgi:putative ABC transport system permease protein
MNDLRYALRSLLRNPGFTAVAVLTLAIGIGANTVVFSYVNALLLAPLPARDPDRVVAIFSVNQALGVDRTVVSVPDFDDWRERARSLRLAAVAPAAFNVSDAGENRRVRASRVTADYFGVMGIVPARGRTFTKAEETSGSAVVILSDEFWRRDFGGDPIVIGRRVRLDEEPFTIVGVLPARWRFPGIPDLWVPLEADRAGADRGQRALFVFGRLARGATLGQTQTEMSAVAAGLAREHPATNKGWDARAVPIADFFRPDAMRLAWTALFGAVLAVLTIACANVASLMLARAAARQREFAVRAAIGGSRFRIVRPLMAESLMLALAGGALGLVLAAWGIDLLRALFPPNIGFLQEIGIEWKVVFFTAATSLGAAVAFGVFPAFHAGRMSVADWLRAGGLRGATPGRRRAQRALVAAQVAMALVLLVVAGLFTRAIVRLQQVEMGFATERVLAMTIALPATAYPEDARAAAFFRDLLARVRALRGVRAAGAASRLPLAGSRFNPRRSLFVEGRESSRGPDLPWAIDVVVTPGFFEALEIPLRHGRLVADADSPDSAPIAVVSETMARRYWPGEIPLGRRFKWSGDTSDAPWIRIVGVVGDVRNDDLGQPPVPQVYLPHAQAPTRTMSLAIAAASDPLALAGPVRRGLAAVDATQQAYDLKTMEQIVREDMGGDPVFVAALAVFAALALLLAAVGIYGVVAYTVSQRTREIGVRLALGATSNDVVRFAARHGLWPVAIGLLVGLAAALAVARALRSLLAEARVSATDPVAFGGVLAALAIAAAVASLLPARRAARVDPVAALRAE